LDGVVVFLASTLTLKVAEGATISAVYPPDEEMLAEYAAWRKTQKEYETNE
jgi:hypothetical protein